MHKIVQNFNLIKNQINEIVNKNKIKITPEIIVVTKTFSLEKFKPLIDVGHLHFGENKVQEAESKWPDVKKKYNNLKLHMVGKLQTNKAKKAVKIFDFIHSLDNAKLANKLSQYERELNRKIKFFIQVNVGDENQKSGISLNELDTFYSYCVKELSLNVIGLMCLPPIDSDSAKYFELIKNKSLNYNLNNLSMGMSLDYKEAIINGSTHLRLGTAILGERGKQTI